MVESDAFRPALCACARALEEAHHNPAVLALWAEFEPACEYIPLSGLPESQHPFSEFNPLAM